MSISTDALIISVTQIFYLMLTSVVEDPLQCMPNWVVMVKSPHMLHPIL